jgi:hypothetical protein
MGGGRGRRSQGGSPLRRRERRLHMVEAASISPRHKLVLVRRDNTEHLLLIGGTTELVVESRIAGTADEAEVDIREREPVFDSPRQAYGRAPVGAVTATATGYAPPRYGAEPESDYPPVQHETEEEDVGFRDSPRAYPRADRDTGDEPDYFASVRAGDDRSSTESYLDRVSDDDETEPNYESYRSTYRREPPEPPRYGEPAPGEEGPDETEEPPAAQSRILNRFLRKDSNE